MMKVGVFSLFSEDQLQSRFSKAGHCFNLGEDVWFIKMDLRIEHEVWFTFGKVMGFGLMIDQFLQNYPYTSDSSPGSFGSLIGDWTIENVE